ncbi:MAG TPA: 1-acyl-sn-glycerol-3-phosphate acyltransferase [Rhizobiales bacterium]|nr:1-acyl-sn-glycerol-3-phosphate acyltransferase [Hyphomicrobiales bacterium]
MRQVTIPDTATIRATLASGFLIGITLIGLPLQALSVTAKLPTARWIPVIYHRLACFGFGVRVRTKGRLAIDKGSVLITANHVSWLDIVVLGQSRPLSFIAKSEVANWPIFGWFAKLERSIFVNRTRRSETGKVAKAIAERLAQGDAMVLFPEGTSSDGNRVLPFRSALIGAASAAMSTASEANQNETSITSAPSVWIQPVSIAYTAVQGLPMGRQHRPLAAWYGDMELMPHLWAILKEGALDVTISYGEPIPMDDSVNRKQIAQMAENEVRAMTRAALFERRIAKQ